MDHNTYLKLDGRGMRIAVVRARFNEEITKGLLDGALEVLRDAGIFYIEIVEVPGSFEIPIAAETLARRGGLDAVVCLGAVIKGATPHFHYISSSCSRGLTDVAVRHGLPISFGVITAENSTQARERSGSGEMNRGREAAAAALEMAAKVREIRGT
ncbi:6,7-dimethyl-8-ribityllumazine synthase [Candidatus Uhrbacteria bacterium RIFCSPHIGHO2_12_FULL_57_11]|uniref:6,7-dimethyl-8-ribityllumazine synthase n=1 Tax=Candidatus Uhrbacteria bacterium RIFCSPHIGHO2_12_FULL_57_11 TaxID=1802398 RepID=A0A1F7ULW9_9BACT|nr:MAG: 6,7-dimethyl-8-ribityllumazine synthase [Candidatus Uhrbacteria bacterium RIFCSPHIGHO2_12_FULL_57_11]